MRVLLLAAVLSTAAAGGASGYWVVTTGMNELFRGPAASDVGRVRNSPGFDLTEAQQFEEFGLYWLGDSFQGLPLTRIFRKDYAGPYAGSRRNIVGLDYGDCTIPTDLPDGAERACSIPLTIQVRPYCEVTLQMVADSVKTGAPVDVRGAPAQWTGGDIILWTSTSSISIAGVNADLVNAAAHALVGLNGQGPTSADAPLGPPGSLDCSSTPPAAATASATEVSQ